MINFRFHQFLLLSLSMVIPGYAQSTGDLIDQGHAAYLDYNFQEAARLYNAASKKMKKADSETTAELKRRRNQLDLANSFLERVAKIEIIDSIVVPRRDFFNAYRLPSASGRLSDASDFPFRKSSEIDYVFTSENGDYKIWSEADSTGYERLREATRLADGKWTTPQAVDDDLSSEGDAVYPFMCDDGVTLYFASDGDESLGGLDIMVATRSDEPGSFLQPRNIGFPFNSPYDDFLLAYDELNDVGWWATDRNNLGDDITIYVFRNPDSRVNYDADDEDLISYARIDNIGNTLDPDHDYSSLLRTIRAITPGAKGEKTDFTLPVTGGRFYTSYEDFHSSSARNMMRRYVEDAAKFEALRKQLDDRRRRYNNTPSRSLGAEIQKLEKEVETDRKALSYLLSEIYKTEFSR